MGHREGVRRMMEVSLDQDRWLDDESERIGMDFAEIIHEAIMRLHAGPPAQPRQDHWFSDGDFDIPRRERVIRLLTVQLEDAHWIDKESKRIGIPRAELIRQGIERLQMDGQRGGAGDGVEERGQSWSRQAIEAVERLQAGSPARRPSYTPLLVARHGLAGLAARLARSVAAPHLRLQAAATREESGTHSGAGVYHWRRHLGRCV